MIESSESSDPPAKILPAFLAGAAKGLVIGLGASSESESISFFYAVGLAATIGLATGFLKSGSSSSSSSLSKNLFYLAAGLDWAAAVTGFFAGGIASSLSESLNAGLFWVEASCATGFLVGLKP